MDFQVDLTCLLCSNNALLLAFGHFYSASITYSADQTKCWHKKQMKDQDQKYTFYINFRTFLNIWACRAVYFVEKEYSFLVLVYRPENNYWSFLIRTKIFKSIYWNDKYWEELPGQNWMSYSVGEYICTIRWDLYICQNSSEREYLYIHISCFLEIYLKKGNNSVPSQVFTWRLIARLEHFTWNDT